MRLRQKILLVIVATMAVVSLLLALAFAAEVWEGSFYERKQQASAIVAAMKGISSEEDMLSEAGRLKMCGALVDAGLAQECAVLDAAGRVAARYGSAGLKPGPPEAAGYNLTEPLPGGWSLQARISPPWAAGRLGRTIRTVIAVMAIGTLILIVVLYGLISRLVLRPVAMLAAATKRVGTGGSTALPLSGRRDEIGELIENFGAMAGEVAASRRDLQERVREALEEASAAHRRLALEQRLSATGKLAAGIAHEINNPLSGMMNAAKSLSRAAAGEKDREYLALIQEGLARIERIVKEILSFSRRSASVGEVDLAEVLDGALGFAAHRLEMARIRVERRIEDKLPKVMGGHGELQQVFLNLIMNSIDAMPGGGVLTIGAARSEGGVRACVEDTGVGMDEATMEAAFDFFFTTKAAGEGTGLGLAIAHQIVQNHGGNMEIRSEPGKGTSVAVELPAMEER